METKFVVSVADALLIDESSNTLVAKATALIDSALKQELSQLEIKGGKGNKTLFVYNYDKKITAELNSATFEPAYFAINSGTEIENALKDVYMFSDKVVLDGTGTGTLAKTPIGDVFVMLPNGTSMTITPTTNTIVIPSFAGKPVVCSYQYGLTVDTIPLNAESLPKIYKLVLQLDMFDGATGKSSLIEVVLNRYKPNGNFELNLNASQATTSKLSGIGLADDEGKYGEINIFPTDGAEIAYAQLAVTPNDLVLATGDNVVLSAYGFRGGEHKPVKMLPSKLVFTSSDNAVATVDATGKVTYVGAGIATIKVEIAGTSTIYDIVHVVCS